MSPNEPTHPIAPGPGTPAHPIAPTPAPKPDDPGRPADTPKPKR